jgi:hypothetical protein
MRRIGSTNNGEQGIYLRHALIYIGSAQEFDRTRILSRFLEDHEFGLGHGHALALQ